MGKITEYIGSQFSNPRGVIGKWCCLLMNIINKTMYRKVISIMHLTEQSKVLDVGYGNGYLIEKIYKNYQSNIYGIDISKDMKFNAEKRNRKAVENGRMYLTIGDCCKLKYENDFFDAVTSVNTIYFWNNTLQGLQEIYRTLKDNGLFYNVVYTKEFLQKLSYTKTGFKFFKQEDYVTLGKQVGFSEVKVQNIVKGKSLLVIYKK